MLPIRYDGAYRRAVSEAFRVVQFNVLAGSLCAPDHFPNVQPRHLDWIARRQRILGALERMEPDIVCLEELGAGPRGPGAGRGARRAGTKGGP